jgi:SOS-response transcriptional repressor LexA
MHYIAHHQREHGVMPSTDEMIDAFGYSTRCAPWFLINKLIAKGYITKVKGQSRGIEFVHRIGNIPIVGTCD